MGENTTISTLPKVSNTNGTELLKTHIARRKATDGPIADYTLCGRLWDRAHPTSGEMCQESASPSTKQSGLGGPCRDNTVG